MATITRRNRGFLSNPNDDALNAETADGAGLARRWWGWGPSRRPSALTALGDASPLSVRNPVINGVVGSGVAGAGAAGSRRLVGQRAAQILWIAVLVYTFLGLPVFGRVLNFLRFAHRVSLAAVLKGLVAGLCQDVAILLQAATVICFVKLVFHESSLLSVGAGASGAASGALSDRGPGSWLRSDSGGAGPAHGGSFGHSSRALRIPVYMPVLTSEYEPSHSSSDDTASTTTSSAAADSFGKHTTLLAGVAGPTTSYLSSLAPRGSWFFSKVRHALATTVTLVLIHAVVVIATVASVVDFCLQVTMHPRLNRAFVEVFLNYAAQFAASLMDEEVLTRTVMWSWAVYVALVVALTFGFYANKFPLLPSVFFAPGGFSSAACFACDRHLHPGKRKDSMLSSTAASASAAGNDAPRGFLALAMLPFTWFTAKPVPPPTHRPRRRSGQNHSLFPSQQPSSLFGCGSSASSSFASFAAKPSPFTVVLRGVVASIAVTLFALSMSLIVDGHGVDMKLMSNAMFSLQTEGFFLKTHSINREEINCTLASNELLATLGKSEVYDIAGLGNDDRCALLWRKTIGFTGDTLFDLTLKNVTVVAPTTVPVTTEASIPAPATVMSDGVGSTTPGATLNEQANATDATDAIAVPDDTKTTAAPTGTTTEPTTEPTTKASMPNIIVINMESWRALDVGVLGGAERKAKFGQSATPEFDALAKTGILYRKHFTQCVQTTRTLLTMLFGMLPSCTETTALKRYATSLNVRGLPQFLKSRGYFNMFWSAVNLSWEYWDKFLLQNGFDKLVDDRKIRKMLHEARQYKNREDDHFSWGMHDHLSFDMLLHAIESAHNATRDAVATKANSTHSAGGTSATLQLPDDPTRVETTPAVLERNDSATSATPTKKPVPKSLLRARGGVDSVDPAKQTTTPTAKKAAANEAVAPVLAGWEGLQEPYFIDMYSISSHNPWALPADYAVPPELASLYTAYTKKYIDAMYFSDEMLGKFVRSMRAKGLLRNTVVVIQGDHGYGRMEHNNPSIADSGIYDEGAHVPFLLLADDLLADADKGTEVSQLTMQSDLMATIADLLGVSPEAPLYQHGYGHSMRRRRSAPTADELAAATVAATALAVDDNGDLVGTANANANSREPATVAPATAAVLAERRVLLCNPFNGMTKGVRTEERKYAFFPDRSFKVFEQATDPSEKSPVRAGFDVATMDVEVKTMFAFATEHVELNQFLFEANKFSTPLPVGKSRLRQSHHYMQPQQQVHVQRLPIPLTDEEDEDDRASLLEEEHADDKDAQHHHAVDSRGDETTAAIATARPHSAPAVPPDTR